MLRRIYLNIMMALAWAGIRTGHQGSRISEIANPKTPPPPPSRAVVKRKSRRQYMHPHQGRQEMLRRRMGGFYSIRKRQAVNLMNAGMDPTSWDVQAQVAQAS